jgi:uncharacterized membrane protein HdeD (DUF308 family)
MAIPQLLLRDLVDHWWVLLLRGILGVLFALLAFAWPGATLLALVFVWGVYAVLGGAFALYMAYGAGREGQRWWPYLLEGLVGLAAGMVAFISPGITAFALLYLIAAWAILTGVFEVVAAIELRKRIAGEWLLGLSGVLSVIFGILLAIQPQAGAVAVVWILGAYALLFGITLIVLAFRVHGLGNRLRQAGAPA